VLAKTLLASITALLDEADAAVIAEFNNQLQTLQRQASALEATLVAAIEAKRAAALLTVSSACIANLNASLACLDASIAAVLAGKSTVLAKTLPEFNNQLQTLQRQASALEATLVAAIEAKRAADLAASWLTQLALTLTIASRSLVCVCSI
jgi:regulator of replication initiation timing